MDTDLMFVIVTIFQTVIFLAVLARLRWVNRKDKDELKSAWIREDNTGALLRKTEWSYADAMKGWRKLEIERDRAREWYQDLFVIPAEGIAIDDAMRVTIESLRSSRAERVREQNMRKVAEQTRDAELKTHLQVYAQLKDKIAELELSRGRLAREISDLQLEKSAAWDVLNENGFESSEYSLHSAVDELLTERAELAEMNEKLRARIAKKGKRNG